VQLARLVAIVTLVACGGATPAVRDDSDSGPFEAATDFKPKAFGVTVSGAGRPIIFIPGLGCPGEVWTETVAHLANYEAHVLTLSGFAGRDAIDEPLSAAVRRDLTRYIRSKKLVDPIIVGHSMGGFIAYWIASYHPELVGPVIIVDASPALSGDLEDAKQLRLKWKNASDEVYAQQLRSAFRGMTSVPARMEPVIEAVTRSNRRAIGDAIYEMMTTNLIDHVKDIKSPVLIVAADGAFKTRIRAQVETIPDHQMIVVPHARHFVMWDAPKAWFDAIDTFLAAHP
jgi:N-formylmaleamate deformylase